MKKRAICLKERAKSFLTSKSAGLDGILVTVGLCIIALVLCVVMKTSLSGFIESIVENMQQKAQTMLELTPTV